ncbi:malate dehydrogenase [Capsulimonas corticalis]|uniref:L-lactate dehydrogenase n=1 Tax=Capsulimonas corticalis TaxID=2219043 RepID=A0A402CS99_9BACT|nr:malate dehydrogenase [Capsulimonas corticalis]BDI28295.1 malate dehydrogenase [Capsulimonas corticalis]
MAAGRKKVSVIGAGNVGATVAFHVAQQGYADVTLLDLPDDLTLERPRKTGSMAQGKALDLNQVSPIVGYDGRLSGTSDYADTAGSDVVVITSGRPRSPGMSREDLLAVNADIVASVASQAVAQSPDAVYIVVSNPLDAMCHVALKATGLPSERVIGQAGVLDSTRYRNYIAAALKISVEDIQAYVLGGHGDQMVPVRSLTTVGGIPIQKWVETGKITEEQLQKIEDDTRQGGGILTNLIGTSAWYAPGVATAEMVEAVLLDRKRILAVTVLLSGEYGVSDLYFGAPTKLGAAGAEEIYDLSKLVTLTDVELAGIKESAGKVQGTVDSLKELGKL